MNIRLLEKQFIGTGEVANFKFTQIQLCMSAYLYEIDSGNGKIHFEVFKRKNVATCIDFENKIFSDTEFKEIYPKSKDFGDWAWCITDKQKAINKFNQLSSNT